MCVLHTRALTCVVMNTGTRWYHFLTRMCVGGMRNFALCVFEGLLLSTGWRWRAWILQVQNVRGFVFYPPAAQLHFAVHHLLHYPVFFELRAGCYWDTSTVCVSDHWRNTSTLVGSDGLSLSGGRSIQLWILNISTAVIQLLFSVYLIHQTSHNSCFKRFVSLLVISH